MAFAPTPPRPQGLYNPQWEHDACGIGAIVNMKGKPSHSLVDRALGIVELLEHRAGKDADGQTGDGVGVLLQISHTFFSQAAPQAGITLGEAGTYGVGMFFLPQDKLLAMQRKKMFQLMVEKEGMTFLGWRDVPIHPEILGPKAASCMPLIQQAFIQKPPDCPPGLPFDRRLYIVRRIFEQAAGEDCYVSSLSSRTIVYKGMLLVGQLRRFYDDLRSEAYESAIAITHSRFSTNTNPSWERAHPYRYLVHNGEINTIRGNVDKMSVREEGLESEVMQDALHKVLPVVDPRGSDSAMLDNTLEFLLMNGMSLPHAVMTVLPEPWQHDKTISRAKRDFYRYHAILMEPWDGPAAILFTDGQLVGAVLDRNGLRPARYYITADDELILSSEVGVAQVPSSRILKKDRLRPGKMLLIDTQAGRLIQDEDLKAHYAAQHPYGAWLDDQLISLEDLHGPNKATPRLTPTARAQLKRAFGYHYEDLRGAICQMAATGHEPITSMGADTPLPILSAYPQPLFCYFKQQFAQVTNPPIDAIREELVMDTTLYIGAAGNLLKPREENGNAIQLSSPILTDLELLKLRSLRIRGFQVGALSILYYRSTSLEKALDRLFIEVDKACKDGVNLLILSDRGVDEYHVAIPSLLAVSAVHQHLVQTKHSANVSLVLESGEPRAVHHFATLLGYGACAVNPYLAHDCIRQLVEEGLLDKDPYQAIADYDQAVVDGIVKIASKMGISTLQSYQGSKMFEAVGLSPAVTDKYFTGTVSRIGGLTLEDIQRQVDSLHTQTFDPLGFAVDLTLESRGEHRYRGGKETHRYNPATISLLQQAVRTGNYDLYQQYAHLLTTAPTNLRSLLRVRYPADGGIPLEEVEPVESILRRFRTGAMSFGSLSPEAHETLAIAMNRLGGRSNSGEGGELPERLHPGPDGVDRCSAVKQVASGRFGVTSEYLLSAQEIQIKMAQGAKPGEGGHLPGEKVYPWVARTRCSTPGVTLISPPPHHDIYSIEDLAQLIYDLKCANAQAEISVKLAAEMGVGTIASGVAKAGAGILLISGYDGGTGAAPKSSLYNAGLPWEIGLAEAHQTLLLNGLRGRVRLEADGKLMNGYDILVAALLGADGFGFATAPLVALGCVMMRVCSLDTCPVGVATQDPALRKNFKGKPEHVENLMHFFAQDLREHMARLGIPTVAELVGRTDLLESAPTTEGGPAGLDLSAILSQAGCHIPQAAAPFDFGLDDTLDSRVLLPAFAQAMEEGTAQTITLEVGNRDRAFGTLFGSHVTRRFGSTLPHDTFTVRCTGCGGQSFGAFLPQGVTLSLTGDCNDYLGKGLCGGKIALMPPQQAPFLPHENIILGNVALYGATGGQVYAAGVAGERFCVRNSGATAVVEGVGNHGCEYMTGGRVVILGPVGANFAAGMSGGVAFVLDEDNDLYLRLNKSMATLEPVSDPAAIQELRALIQAHVDHTGSLRGQAILADFAHYLPLFKEVSSPEYRRVRESIRRLEEEGMTPEQAAMAAFYQERT